MQKIHEYNSQKCNFEQSSYKLCYIVKDEMVLLKSFYKKPLLKPLVSKITYIAFSNNKNSKKNWKEIFLSYFQKLCCFAYIIIVIIIYNEWLLNNTNHHIHGKQTQVAFENSFRKSIFWSGIAYIPREKKTNMNIKRV